MYINKKNFTSTVPYIVNYYLIIKIIFGIHGIVYYYKEKKQMIANQKYLIEIKSINDVNQIKSELINADIVNIRYLKELVRVQYSMIENDEKVLILK